MKHVTHILRSIEGGDPKAANELLPLVYAELRKLAAYKMAHCAAGHTLQPTQRPEQAVEWRKKLAELEAGKK